LGCKKKILNDDDELCADCYARQCFELEDAAREIKPADPNANRDVFDELILKAEDSRDLAEREAAKVGKMSCPMEKVEYRDDTQIAKLRMDGRRCLFADKEDKFCERCRSHAVVSDICYYGEHLEESKKYVLKPVAFVCVLQLLKNQLQVSHPNMWKVYWYCDTGKNDDKVRNQRQMCDHCWSLHRTKKTVSVMESMFNLSTRQMRPEIFNLLEGGGTITTGTV
jgi:hypothetical protein